MLGQCLGPALEKWAASLRKSKTLNYHMTQQFPFANISNGYLYAYRYDNYSQKPNVKQPNPPIKWWVDKQNVVKQYNEKIFTYKKDEALIQAITWMNLEDIMLSERTQVQKVMKEELGSGGGCVTLSVLNSIELYIWKWLKNKKWVKCLKINNVIYPKRLNCTLFKKKKVCIWLHQVLAVALGI